MPPTTVHDIQSTVRYTCRHNCLKSTHAERILHAIRSAVDNVRLVDQQPQLAAYIVRACRNFARIANADRFTALHAVAQCTSNVNLAALAEFLINHRADVNATVESNGWTPLHYACAYNNLAVAAVLSRHGANMGAYDHQFRKPVALLPLPEQLLYGTDEAIERSEIMLMEHKTEIWAWGHTRNGNVGLLRDSTRRDAEAWPQQLDQFNRISSDLAITKVAVSPYHSLFVDDSERLFAVGQGQGGLLGNDSEQIIQEPERVMLTANTTGDQVVAVSVSRYTSMALTRRNQVYTCGTNKFRQLGHAADKVPKFKPVNFILGQTLIGISSEDKYSVAWDSQRLWVWGTCVGQFGSKVAPDVDVLDGTCALIPFHSAIRHVATAEWAVAVGMSNTAEWAAAVGMSATVIVMHNHKNRTFTLPALTTLTGMALDATKADGTVQLVLMTADNNFMLWTSEHGLIRVVRPFEGRLNQVLRYRDNELHLIADGCVYRCHLRIDVSTSNTRASGDDFIYPTGYRPFVTDCVANLSAFERIPLLDHVLLASCDAGGKTFVAIQRHAKRHVVWPELPDGDRAMAASLSVLLAEATVDDGVVDVVFALPGNGAPPIGAHRFVLLHRAPKMQWLLELAEDPAPGSSDGRPAVVRLTKEWLTASMMQMILRIVYEGYVMTESDAADIRQSVGPGNKYDPDTAYTKFCKFAITCGLSDYTFPQQVRRYQNTACMFSRSRLPQLYDVTLVCGPQQVAVSAHKCILTARSEYFRVMLSRNWSETDGRVQLAHVPDDCMRLILEHLYNSDDIGRHPFSDAELCVLAQICDHMMLDDMSAALEAKLIDRISAKKCLDLLGFATDVHLPQLAEQCLRFVCTNLSRMLERRLFDHAEPCQLEQFNRYWQANGYAATRRADGIPDPVFNRSPLTAEELLADVGKATLDLSAMPAVPAKKEERSTTCCYAKKQRATASDEVHSIAAAPAALPASSAVVQEAARIAEELSEQFASWSKVGGRREAATSAKRALSTVHANEVLALESKTDDAYVRLDHCDDGLLPMGTEFERMTVSLGVFSPDVPTKRMSQRERKRLSSTSENAASAAAAAAKETGAGGDSPLANVWAIRNPQLLTPDNPTSDPVRSLFTPDGEATATTTSRKGKNRTSLVRIQKQEQREKNNLSRMLNKPLWMTQAEELALVELRKFYNVENVFDERIVVERVPPEASTKNWHSVWYQDNGEKHNRLSL